MSYIGRGTDKISNVEKLDNISFSGSTATFNLTKGGTAFIPSSAECIRLAIDGIEQGNNYTVSGSQITFDFTPSGSSTNNWIYHIGVGVITTPGDGTVTSAKLGSSAVTTAKIDADAVDGTKIADDSISDEHLDVTAITGQPEKTSLVDADKFLISDSAASNALKYVQKSNLPSGGLVFVGQASTTSDVTAITLDNVFTSTYENYLLVGDYTPDNTSGASARFVFRQGGSSGSDLTGGEYNYHFIRMNADSDSLNNHRSQSNTYCEFTAPVKDDVVRVGVRLAWTVFDPVSSNRTTLSGTGKFTATDGNSGFITGECDYKGTQSVTGIKFYFSADNVANAQFRVYGIVNS